MNTHADKTQENKSQSVSVTGLQLQSSGESIFQSVDNRHETVVQRKLQEIANNSPRTMQLKAIQEMPNNSPQVNQAVQLQAMADNYAAQQQQSIQKKENNTGLPDDLKTNIENVSGYSMDDVTVHLNSAKPTQLHAYAYAQGTNIHIASGQEKHLPHEAWHVVQQKQGRVKPTMQMEGGVNVNDDKCLEKEADVMGDKALEMKTEAGNNKKIDSDLMDRRSKGGAQRKKREQPIGYSDFSPIQMLMGNVESGYFRLRHPRHPIIADWVVNVGADWIHAESIYNLAVLLNAPTQAYTNSLAPLVTDLIGKGTIPDLAAMIPAAVAQGATIAEADALLVASPNGAGTTNA
ncbi:eCIS core domain-containing protein, partial [Desulfobacter vibrioformis]|uniref:eCIS core domain-containing protein n=1 Tax=Desulfobacter vibrioformis TaxID=34031 RepID=UPI001B80C9DA